MAEHCGWSMLSTFTARKSNRNMLRVLKGVVTIRYTEFPRLETSSSNVRFQTMFVVTSVKYK